MLSAIACVQVAHVGALPAHCAHLGSISGPGAVLPHPCGSGAGAGGGGQAKAHPCPEAAGQHHLHKCSAPVHLAKYGPVLS